MDGTEGAPLGIPGISGAAEVGRTVATTTYRATDDTTGRPVVAKVLHREATPEVRARFDYDQARLAELADHPNIVAVLRHGYTPDDHPVVVSAVVDGGSMADKVGSGLDGPGVLDLGIRVAGALESAHRHNVVHGDLRPEDIRVDAEGEPEVADFGIAMATGHGPDRATEVARLAHAAPEQLQTHVPTPASDVYGLGSVLYALLAGHPAYVRPGDSSLAGVGARILSEPPPDLRGTGVPDPVVDAIERAMQKDPTARWSSAEAFGLALQQAQITLGLPISPMTVVGPDRVVPRPDVETEPTTAPTAPTAPGGRRSRTGLLVAGLVVVTAAVAGGVVVLGGGDDEADDDARTGVTRPEREDVDLEEVSDDEDAISVGVIESWSDVDGRPFDDGQGGSVPDLVAAEDADEFLGTDGFRVSGIEVTVVEGVHDAEELLDARVEGRGLNAQCTTDLPPDGEEVAGFDGFLQRFEGCDGNELVVFAGVDGGRGLVVEVHLVEPEDAEALEDVLESIDVS